MTNEGVTKTKQVVEGIKGIGVEPTHLLCSPLTRTQQAATIAKDILRIQSDMAITPELVYDQSPMLLFSILQTLASDVIVMYVGHEPHLVANCRTHAFWPTLAKPVVQKGRQ